MQLKDPNRGTRAFADDGLISMLASILGADTAAVMPSQWWSHEGLTEAEIEARSLAFGMVRQMAFDLQEAFDRRAGIRTSSDGNSFSPNDLPELLSWIFDEGFYFAPTMPLPPRRNDADRRDLVWHAELRDDGPFTFANCVRLLRLDVVVLS
jgi:hypothetical protein